MFADFWLVRNSRKDFGDLIGGLTPITLLLTPSKALHD
jgi:hypothetical protein